MQLDALQVLKRIMAAHNINAMRVTPPFEGLENFDYGLRQALDPQFDWQGFGNLLLCRKTPSFLPREPLSCILPCSMCRMRKTPFFSLARGPRGRAVRNKRNGPCA